jgi:hypothetical protein
VVPADRTFLAAPHWRWHRLELALKLRVGRLSVGRVVALAEGQVGLADSEAQVGAVVLAAGAASEVRADLAAEAATSADAIPTPSATAGVIAACNTTPMWR